MSKKITHIKRVGVPVKDLEWLYQFYLRLYISSGNAAYHACAGWLKVFIDMAKEKK